MCRKWLWTVLGVALVQCHCAKYVVLWRYRFAFSIHSIFCSGIKEHNVCKYIYCLSVNISFLHSWHVLVLTATVLLVVFRFWPRLVLWFPCTLQTWTKWYNFFHPQVQTDIETCQEAFTPGTESSQHTKNADELNAKGKFLTWMVAAISWSLSEIALSSQQIHCVTMSWQ